MGVGSLCHFRCHLGVSADDLNKRGLARDIAYCLRLSLWVAVQFD